MEAPAPRREVTRILQRLRMLIFLSPTSQRAVEAAAGFSRGYLSQILGGHIELKYRHLIQVLEAMDFDPGVFFADLYPRRTLRPSGLDQFQRRSRPLGDEIRLQLVRLYGLGLESLEELDERLDRCEDAFTELEALGLLRRGASDP